MDIPSRVELVGARSAPAGRSKGANASISGLCVLVGC